MSVALKWILGSAAGIVILAACVIGAISHVGKTHADDVREMCATKIGVAIEEVIPRARALGFSEAEQGALDGGLVVTPKVTDDSLPGVTEGTIRVGKVSLPQFLRNYCEIAFHDRKVTSTRTWTLD